MPSGSLGTALENPLECLRKGFEKPLEGLWDAFGTLLEALGRLWGVFGGLGSVWDSLWGGFVHLSPAPWGGPEGALGDHGGPSGTLLERLRTFRNLKMSDSWNDVMSTCILDRFSSDFDSKFDEFGLDFAPVFPPKMKWCFDLVLECMSTRFSMA